MAKEWIAFTLQTPVEEALAIVASRLDVSLDDLETCKTGGALLVREIPELGNHDFISFNSWMYRTYPQPGKKDTYRREYELFGYDVYLINAYPSVFKATGVAWEDIFVSLRVDYEWDRIDDVIDGELTEEVLEEFLRGQPIVYLLAEYEAPETLGIKSIESFGVLVWTEEVRARTHHLAVFVNDNDELMPLLVRDSNCRVDEDAEFDGWE